MSEYFSTETNNLEQFQILTHWMGPLGNERVLIEVHYKRLAIDCHQNCNATFANRFDPEKVAFWIDFWQKNVLKLPCFCFQTVCKVYRSTNPQRVLVVFDLFLQLSRSVLVIRLQKNSKGFCKSRSNICLLKDRILLKRKLMNFDKKSKNLKKNQWIPKKIRKFKKNKKFFKRNFFDLIDRLIS